MKKQIYAKTFFSLSGLLILIITFKAGCASTNLRAAFAMAQLLSIIIISTVCNTFPENQFSGKNLNMMALATQGLLEGIAIFTCSETVY